MVEILSSLYTLFASQVWRDPNGVSRGCATSRQCPSTHYCTPVTTWTGTVYKTRSLCCPTKNYVCSQPRDSGIRCSSTRITRYYFSAESKSCQTFQYNGCEGHCCRIKNYHVQFSILKYIVLTVSDLHG